MALLGTILLWAGGIATLTLVPAPAGLPLVLLGLWWRRRGTENLAAVEAGFVEFLSRWDRSPGSVPLDH